MGDESSFVNGVRLIKFEAAAAPVFCAVVLKTEDAVLVCELVDRTQFSKSPCCSSPSSAGASIFVSRAPSSPAAPEILPRPDSSRDLDGFCASLSAFTGSSSGESRGFDFARSRSLALFFAARGADGKKSEKPAVEARDMVLRWIGSTLVPANHRSYDVEDRSQVIGGIWGRRGRLQCTRLERPESRNATSGGLASRWVGDLRRSNLEMSVEGVAVVKLYEARR